MEASNYFLYAFCEDCLLKYYLPKILYLSLVSLLSFSLLIINVSAQERNDQKALSLRSTPIINSGTFPIGIDVNPITDKLYVANQFSNTISVIDIDKSKIETSIEVGSSPYDVEVNPFLNRIYSSNRDSNTISVIDGFTNKALANIEVGDSPLGIGINLATSMLYVANFDSHTISVIDSIDNHVVKTIKHALSPYNVAVNPNTNKIYVSDISKDSILVLEGKDNSLISTIPVGLKPSVLAINALTNTIYVSNFGNYSISVINGTSNKNVKNILVGNQPVGIVVNPQTNKIYVDNMADDTISVINGTTNKVIKTVPLEPTKGIFDNNYALAKIPLKVTFPFIANSLSVDPNLNTVYITNTKSNGIITLDGNIDQVTTKIFVDIKPPNAGNVNCNDVILGSDEYISLPVDSSVTCEAVPDRGYDFSHWSVKNNTKENPVVLNVTGHGTLTANFKGAIFTETFLILTAVSVGLISTVGGWLYRQKSRFAFKRNLRNIDYTYEMLAKNNKDECIKQLEQIQSNLNYLHRKGKINESQLEFLEKRINSYISRLNNA